MVWVIFLYHPPLNKSLRLRKWHLIAYGTSKHPLARAINLHYREVVGYLFRTFTLHLLGIDDL